MRASTRWLVGVLGAMTAVALAVPSPVGATGNEPLARYRVRFVNRTDGQPLTPPVVATHDDDFHVFEVGGDASFGVKEIAENGNNAPLLSDLDAEDDVFRVVQGGNGPLVPEGTPGSAMFDDSVRFRIAAPQGDHVLSLVSMLVCTNDGFTGVDGVTLPDDVGDRVVVRTNGYDAGTERNTEDFADIVPPCQDLIGVSSGDPGTGTSDPALAQDRVIKHHNNIQGKDDLVPAIHGWEDPVSRIVIERVD